MSWFGFDQSSSGAEEPSFYHKEYCSSDSEVSSMTSTSQAGLHTALDQTLNANGELSKEPSQVQSRQDMVAQLLGQALSHRREKDERLRFFEESTDLHVILDVQGVANENPDFVMSQFNPAWTQVLGWSAEELNGKSMRGIVHPEDVSTLLAFLDTHLDDASTATKSTVTDERSFKASPFSNQHRVEHRLRTKDGAYRWISWSVAPSQKKSPLMVIGRDITSRKQAAFKLWESKRRLQESQDIARLGHWELDLVENVLQWSDEIYRLFQVDRHKFGASYEAFLNAIHPDDRDAVNDAYTMSLKTKKPYSIIHRLRYADGGIRWVRELCRTEYDGSGNPLRSIGTVQDITDLRLAQEALQVAKDKAEEADRLKSAFLANMSHEIRTPMNAVLGYTDLMLMECDKLPSTHCEYLEIIKGSGNVLLALIGDILDISKIEAGQMLVMETPFSIHKALRDIASNATGLLSKKCSKDLVLRSPDVDMSLDGVDFTDCVVGDPARIQQVMNNLMTNAIKFTDSGSVEFGVRMVGNSNGKKMLDFFVKDTGRGIELEQQEIIFAPFRQTHSSVDSHELGGTGLGLSIARHLAELMGGSMRLESHIGSGSTFHLSIPYIPAANEVGMVASEQQAYRQSSTNHRFSCRILVVDDSKVNLKLAERLLEKMGLECKTACNGRVAVDIFESCPSIRLTLMDKEMPTMDGLCATREIRQLEAIGQADPIPIIALTAAAMAGDREECLEAGCTDYLSKPLDPEKLRSMMSRFL